MTDRLSGRVAIVTGSGGGIGRAAAKLFAGEGACVVVATRTAASGQSAVDEIVAAGGRAALVAVDISTRISVRDLIARSADAFGAIDIVLHNAAVMDPGPLVGITDETLQQMMAVNLHSAFWFASEAAPYLQKSDAARLLFTSSTIGVRQMLPGFTAYGASKAGLNGFIRQAGYEWAAQGITVNGVEPGFVLTERYAEQLTPEQIARSTSTVPRGRPGSPEDIAQALLFLATPEAGHITGQTIVVDGGQSLGMPLPS
jgi:3-oxoacyl-[acyl-carrier protein] reductase